MVLRRCREEEKVIDGYKIYGCGTCFVKWFNITDTIIAVMEIVLCKNRLIVFALAYIR